MKYSTIALNEELVETAKKIGVSQTMQILKGARQKPSRKDSANEKKIIRSICQTYCVTKKSLQNGNSRGARTEALTACYILLEKFLNYNTDKLHMIFRKDKSNIRKCIKNFNFLKEEDKLDQKIIEKVRRCQAKIEAEIKLA